MPGMPMPAVPPAQPVMYPPSAPPAPSMMMPPPSYAYQQSASTLLADAQAALMTLASKNIVVKPLH